MPRGATATYLPLRLDMAGRGMRAGLVSLQALRQGCASLPVILGACAPYALRTEGPTAVRLARTRRSPNETKLSEL